MNIILLILFLLFPSIGHAEYLGCIEPNEAVEIKSLFMDVTGARVDPTSPGCEIFDPNDTTATTCTSGPTKIGTIVGWYESSHTIPASPLAGTWYAKVNGTISSVVHEGTDTFYVVDTAGDCASRTGVITTNAVTVGAINTNVITATSIDTTAVDEILVIASGTEGAGTSTTLKVYTALGVANERKYNNMCLYSASNGERSRILSTGNGFFNVRGFSVAPADGTALKIYSDGCL